ncbi:MAG: diguanylate cyclase [Planctomycetales bacterium]|nr:diguanylate cyclase [Planctomycetales bacterium]
MFNVFLGIVGLIFTGVLGAGIGWLLHNQFSSALLGIELASLKQHKNKASRQATDNDYTAKLMAKLAELTTGVAAEVGKHTGNIEAINAELAEVKDGDAGAVVAAVKKILQANQQMQEELHHAEARLKDQQQELITQTEAARTDQLTKITNRRALDEELCKCVLEFQKNAQPFCVMVLDVDFFKRFNDTHGHLAGDEVLKFVAQNIKTQLRESEFVARYGGEEFVVVFRGETADACRDRADRLRASIYEHSIAFEGKEFRVAASAGVAQIGIGEDEKGLIRRADEALYISKKAGRNCAHWNDGRQNLPITPGLLAKPVTTISPSSSQNTEVEEARNHRFELDNIRFSDSSFSPNLDRRVAEWKRTGYSFSMAVCAIDDLEQIRQLHGEEILQKIVATTASVVCSCLRDMDQVAVYGDGGFAISLPTAQVQIAAQVAERVRKSIERLYLPTGILPQFTVSIGRAQSALEAAQAGSGNCTFLHDGLRVVPATLRHLAMA